MLIKTFGAAVQGIDAILVTVETVVERGIAFTMVGMPDTAVKESYARVVSAMQQSGLEFPRRRIVINLSPADVRKEGAAYDLPIAVSILAASERIPRDRLDRFMIMGEPVARRLRPSHPRRPPHVHSRPLSRLRGDDCARSERPGGRRGK